MNEGYRADAAELDRHATTLRELAGRLGTVSRAADTPLAPDAYGLLCGFLAETTTDAECQLRAAIGTLARAGGANADGVRGCATDYADLERRLTGLFGGVR